MKVIKKIIAKIALILLYNNRTLAKVKLVKVLSKIELDRLQERKLKKVLWEAVHYVPFYSRMNIDVDFDNFSLEELNKFPVIDKGLMRANVRDFMSTRRMSLINSTSGSSGTPFVFRLGFTAWVRENLNFTRSLDVKGYAYRIGDPIVVVRSYVPGDDEPCVKVDVRKNIWYISPFHINPANIQTIYNFILRSGAKVIRGYPSSLLILTTELEKLGITEHPVKIVSTSSEMLLPYLREILTKFWRGEILDYYGQNENVVSFSQCSFGRYHNNDDYGYVEILNNNIVGTSLNNLVMPFIRYNTQDKASVDELSSARACQCGSNFSVPVSSIDGRNDDILLKKDRTKVSTANFSTAFKDLSSIRQFQFIQYPDLQILVRLVVNYRDEEDLEIFVQRSVSRLGEDISLSLEIVDEIQRDETSLKVKTTIQKGSYD